MIHVLKEIERLRYDTILTNDLHAVFFRVVGLLQLVHQSQPLEGKIAKRHERFTDVISGKLFFFHDQNVMPFFSQQGSRGGTSRSGPDDYDVTCVLVDPRNTRQGDQWSCL